MNPLKADKLERSLRLEKNASQENDDIDDIDDVLLGNIYFVNIKFAFNTFINIKL